jgi:hypothetical protein
MAALSKRQRRRNSKCKTRRNKKEGGMHKSNFDVKKLSTHASAYRSTGVTPVGDPFSSVSFSSVPPEVPNDALMMSHRSFALASILNRAHDAHIPFTKSRSKMETKLYEPTGHLALAIEGERLCNEANRLCSHLASMTDAQMWNNTTWFTRIPTAEAHRDCTEAIQLYEKSIALRYLPAYAPLAWIGSHLNPAESLRLCDECILICDADHRAPHATLAKADCNAIRAFIQVEMEHEMEEENELSTPFPRQQMEAMSAMESMQTFKTQMTIIARDSVRYNSKYGYALLWLLTNDHDAKKTAEEMGLDFRIVVLADSLHIFQPKAED